MVNVVGGNSVTGLTASVNRSFAWVLRYKTEVLEIDEFLLILVTASLP